MAYCPNCGGEVSVDARFCPHCGRPAGTLPPASPTSPPVAPPVAPTVVQPSKGTSRVTTILGVLIAVGLLAYVFGRSPGSPESGGAGLSEPTTRATLAPTRAPWPEGWDAELCYAIDQLGDANGHILTASEMGSAFDFDGAIEEAEQAATDAGEASDAAAQVDLWPPAHSVAVYLGSAADELEKAANLMVLGLVGVDAATLEEAIKHQEKATYQLGRADTAAESLVAKYGTFC